MTLPLAVALDIGTSSARALAFTADGEKAAPEIQIPYEQHTTPDGGVETDPDRLLELAACCLDQLLEHLQGEVVAVGVSCFWHSLLAVDSAGKPLTAALSWADNRAAGSLATLRDGLDENRVHARTGCVFHTSYWPAKLLWLHQTRPQLFKGTPTWLGMGDYLALKWFGHAHTSISMASGTGLFNQETCNWDGEVLGFLPLTEQNLPPLQDQNQAMPPLLDHLSRRWPALQKAKWYPALGDGACSNVGSGCADPTRMGLNAGTSGALRVVVPGFSGPAPKGLWHYRLDRRRSLVGGALSNAGNALAWSRGLFQVPEDWSAQVASMAPDSHGLTVLPFLAGERSPLWNPNARFVLEGATLHTSSLQVVRAVLEGTALRYAAVANLLFQVAPGAKIVFSGGALEKVPVWQSILCDAIGSPLFQSTEAEASARGAALMALESAGVLADVAKIGHRTGQTLHPNRDHHKIYAAALERQNLLYNKIYLSGSPPPSS